MAPILQALFVIALSISVNNISLKTVTDILQLQLTLNRLYISYTQQGIKTTRRQDKSPPVQPKTTRPQCRKTRHDSRQLDPNIKTTHPKNFLCTKFITIIIFFPMISQINLYSSRFISILIGFNLNFNRFTKLSTTVLFKQFYLNSF